MKIIEKIEWRKIFIIIFFENRWFNCVPDPPTLPRPITKGISIMAITSKTPGGQRGS